MRNFANKESYRKWNAYRFIHGVNSSGHERIEIHGRPHHVHHLKRVGERHGRPFVREADRIFGRKVR